MFWEKLSARTAACRSLWDEWLISSADGGYGTRTDPVDAPRVYSGVIASEMGKKLDIQRISDTHPRVYGVLTPVCFSARRL